MLAHVVGQIEDVFARYRSAVAAGDRGLALRLRRRGEELLWELGKVPWAESELDRVRAACPWEGIAEDEERLLAGAQAGVGRSSAAGRRIGRAGASRAGASGAQATTSSRNGSQGLAMAGFSGSRPDADHSAAGLDRDGSRCAEPGDRGPATSSSRKASQGAAAKPGAEAVNRPRLASAAPGQDGIDCGAPADERVGAAGVGPAELRGRGDCECGESATAARTSAPLRERSGSARESTAGGRECLEAPSSERECGTVLANGSALDQCALEGERLARRRHDADALGHPARGSGSAEPGHPCGRDGGVPGYSEAFSDGLALGGLPEPSRAPTGACADPDCSAPEPPWMAQRAHGEQPSEPLGRGRAPLGAAGVGVGIAVPTDQALREGVATGRHGIATARVAVAVPRAGQPERRPEDEHPTGETIPRWGPPVVPRLSLAELMSRL